jgi:hypothetical protein
MGGLESEVSDQTTDILLESAMEKRPKPWDCKVMLPIDLSGELILLPARSPRIV